MVEPKVLIYSKNITIFWDDMDAYGHVNNAKYFTYIQECRIDWFMSVGITLDSTKVGPVLASITNKFVRPITYPANIVVELYATGKNGKKILFEHIIRDQNNPDLTYSVGDSVIVWFDFINNCSINEPQEFSHLLYG